MRPLKNNKEIKQIKNKCERGSVGVDCQIHSFRDVLCGSKAAACVHEILQNKRLPVSETTNVSFLVCGRFAVK